MTELSKSSNVDFSTLLLFYGISVKLTGTEHPDMTWETDSLNSAIETLYALAITDKTSPLKMCKHCANAYCNSNSRSEFCSVKCRNQYNVRAFRERNKGP